MDPKEYAIYAKHPYVRKMLDTISGAEGSPRYDTAFGGGTIPGLEVHPGTRHEFTQTDGKKNVTTAAGRYQFIKPTWEEAQKKLGLPDFGPESQDMAAVYLLQKNGALPAVLAGDFDTAIQRSGKTWASLPSSPYAQPKRSEGFIKNLLNQAAEAAFPAAQAGTLPNEGGQQVATNTMADKVAKARAAGYSDDEISAFVTEQPTFQAKIKKAREAGYSDDEISQFLGVPITAAPSASVAPAVAPEMAPIESMKATAPMPLNQDNVHQRTAAEAAAQQQFAQQQAAQGGGVAGGLAMGVRDPIDAAAQGLRRMVPESIGNAVDAFGNRLADAGLPVARSNGVAGIDAGINQVNQRYEAARKAAGRDGIDFARIGGNVVGAAPLIAATPAVAGLSLPARIGVGAVQGGAMGAMNPVLGEKAQADFADEKLGQVGLGAAFGGVTPIVASGLSRLVSPIASRAGSPQQLLAREGVQLTPGQALGGLAMKAEDKLMSVPIVGGFVNKARDRSVEQLNRAVYNRVLAPIGQKTTLTGREAIDDVSLRIGQAYDDVLSKVKFAPDSKFTNDIAKLRAMGKSLPARESATLNSIIDREIMAPLSVGKAIDGEAFKAVESQLGNQASALLSTTDYYQRQVGNAILEAQKALRAGLLRTNKPVAKRLTAVNRSFSELTRLQRAGASSGAAEGVFTPAQLASAVRAADKTVRKNAYARGKAPMQDLSDAAKTVMSQQVPDSGTAGRIMGAVGLGGLMTNPLLTIGSGLGASLPYMPGLDKVTVKAILNRPQGAEALARQIQNIPPGLLGILAQ